MIIQKGILSLTYQLTIPTGLKGIKTPEFKMTNKMSSYEQQAIDFLRSTGATFKAEFVENAPYFQDEKESRDIYNVTLTKGSRKYTFKFGQSLQNSTKWIDKRNGNEFTTTGSTLKGNVKVIRLTYLSEYCRKVAGVAPTAYDVLACLQKYPIYDFADFCADFGYEEDSRKAYKIYKAVKREWENVAMLFNDKEIEQLREIQ